MDMVSVIVPIYNVEQYLKNCIESIINQSYTNLEIILIDDGSSDNCGKICDEFAQLDQRIKVIHKINGGLSDARNLGLSHSAGKFILFVDGDDWIDKDHIQNLMKFANQDTVVCCGYKIVWEDNVYINNFEKKQIYNANEFISLLAEFEIQSNCFFGLNPIGNYVWNKIYPRRYFDNIKFPVGKHYEDIFIAYKVLSLAKLVVVNGCASYNYIQRNNSIVSRKTKKSQFNWVESRLSQELDVGAIGGKVLRDSKVLTLVSAVGTYIYKCKGDYDLTVSEILNLQKIVRERLCYLNKKEVFSKTGIKALMFLCFPGTLSFFINLKNR